MKTMGRNNRVTRALVLGAAAIAIGGGGVALAANASAATWYFGGGYDNEAACREALKTYVPPQGAVLVDCYPADEATGERYEIQYLM